jgi:NDP-sugar pyrophosphorylase family protein
MLKIIIPIAGTSDLFSTAGFPYPKPLIDIKGIPMIQWVIEKASSIPNPNQFIFIIREQDSQKYHLDNTLKLLSPNCQIVKLRSQTKGALCSILMTIDLIRDEDSLIILNGDQIIDEDFTEILNFWEMHSADAGILTFNSVHPRWSYALVPEKSNQVLQTAEKNPISNHAIAGYYYFKEASSFFNAAYKSILKDSQFEGQYFTSPVLNEYILANKNVLHYKIANENYHSFYSPQLVKDFEKR